MVECSGKAKEALEAYRRRLGELEALGRPKPDMIANRELKGAFTPDRVHGELPGVPIGLMLRGRGEAAILGIHRLIASGIDYLSGEPCYAVCLSGGYADDDDWSSADGTIYYTGMGGQKNRKQVEDQNFVKGNTALMKSVKTGLPVRVIRLVGKKGTTYQYLGLYCCTNCREEKSVQSDKKVLKFKLVPWKVAENLTPALGPLKTKLPPRIKRPIKAEERQKPAAKMVPRSSLKKQDPHESSSKLPRNATKKEDPHDSNTVPRQSIKKEDVSEDPATEATPRGNKVHRRSIKKEDLDETAASAAPRETNVHHRSIKREDAQPSFKAKENHSSLSDVAVPRRSLKAADPKPDDVASRHLPTGAASPAGEYTRKPSFTSATSRPSPREASVDFMTIPRKKSTTAASRSSLTALMLPAPPPPQKRKSLSESYRAQPQSKKKKKSAKDKTCRERLDDKMRKMK